MAGAMVASAALSALFNVLLERLASREVVDFLRGGQLSRTQLQNFETTLNTVCGVLDDAEEKQITSPFVKKWLDDLKDVAYEAEDFLDEIAYKLEFKQVPQSCSDQVRNLLVSSINPCRNGVGNTMRAKFEEILGRLEFLLRQKDALGLGPRAGVQTSSSSSTSSQRRSTSCLVDDSGIYGRIDDKEAIIRSVLSEDANSKHLGVVPIVGMGGIGKTTLAQLVYNDSRVKHQFDKFRVWVCVSEKFDELELTKNILKEIGLCDCDSLPLNQLQLKLEEKVRGEKVLFVLDDVWNDNYADWDRLLIPLNSVARGSKVLVTTRIQSVASVMSTVPSHHLKELNADDCWSLFAKHAFDDCSPSSYPDLVEIGRRISRRCKGLPLAAKTMGGLLRCKREDKEWKKILESNIWDLQSDNIIPALRLSYHYLPPHLKQCFAYCAMFPKDFKFRKEDLVLWWMAEGFIIQGNQHNGMEEIGAEYLEDLASRSFFQKFGGSKSPDCFVMHDLIHDLARSISGEFCFNGKDVNLGGLTGRTRHLYLTRNGGSTLADAKVEVLHSLICREGYALRHPGNNISSLRLRVLDLADSYYGSRPHLLASSKRLRLVRLRHYYYLERLPRNVPTLCKLQTLVVEYCPKFTTLPDSIGNLKQLRHLSLNGTSLGKLPDSIGKLEDLRHLGLAGTRIERLPESICGLYYLQTLILSWCRQLVELPDKMMDLINLCRLDIEETPRLKYMPVHMGKLVKLQTLARFVVGKGRGSKIRELGELRNLQGKLVLLNLHNVDDEQDALGANLNEKKGLVDLEFHWKEFCWGRNVVDNSDLDRSVLQHLQPHVSVRDITIRGYRGASFSHWVGDSSYSNIVRLVLRDCRNCTSLPPLGQLPSLEELWIEWFRSVVSVGLEFFYGSRSNSIQPFRSLKKLSFSYLAQWKEWICADDDNDGNRITFFPLLMTLSIRECPKLRNWKIKHISLPSLRSLSLIHCSELESVGFIEEGGDGSLPSSLQELTIEDIAGLVRLGLRKLPSLSTLWLRDNEDMESFPDNILLPSNLSEIRIFSLWNIKSLDSMGLPHLTCLQTLEIRNCPKLERIPEEGLPSSLSRLEILYCPLLEKRCEREKGEDWPNISHIPIIYIKG
ncbi:hypothetical protein Tsubulata_228779 [Turnera subulata]|uniref:Disease resistance RPP13-like protein 1 n=1 Tax=Turnera subulata TaxID=218843 RepID=A0A9Q0IXC8_9ROSI|nr:hypothetical protein Tsubulata_228779 [Turnera subulata]